MSLRIDLTTTGWPAPGSPGRWASGLLAGGLVLGGLRVLLRRCIGIHGVRMAMHPPADVGFSSSPFNTLGNANCARLRADFSQRR